MFRAPDKVYSIALRLSFIFIFTILRLRIRATRPVKSKTTTGAISHINQLIPPIVPKPIVLNTI